MYSRLLKSNAGEDDSLAGVAIITQHQMEVNPPNFQHLT
jgi:hypothetical protein